MAQNALGKHRRGGAAFKDLFDLFPDDTKRLLDTAVQMGRLVDGKVVNRVRDDALVA